MLLALRARHELVDSPSSSARPRVPLHEGSLPSSELTTLARTTFQLLRLAAQGQLVVANAERVARWLDRVHGAHGYDDYRALMEYVASAGSEEGMIEAIIEHTREDVKESAMTTADWLEARGFRKGREEGQVSLLLRLLEHRFGGLPKQVEAKVLAAGPRQVEEWALRLLSAGSLEEVIGVP